MKGRGKYPVVTHFNIPETPATPLQEKGTVIPIEEEDWTGGDNDNTEKMETVVITSPSDRTRILKKS